MERLDLGRKPNLYKDGFLFKYLKYRVIIKTGEILEYYSAKELNVEQGDSIEKIKSLNGLTWSKNIKKL